MIFKIIYTLFTIVVGAKTASYGIFCVKNKEKGAFFLFLLSALLLTFSFVSIWLNY